MARLPRFDLPNVAQHVVQRGNNRQAIFFHDDDYGAYLQYLREALLKNECTLYAFVLMTNPVRLLTQCEAPSGVSRLMQSVGRRYVRFVNATHRRSGTLFEGRFKSSLVDSERYLLTCLRYIELNPVRAGLVSHPGDYRWSSYRPQAGESIMDWLAGPNEYRRRAASPETRALVYREPFKQPLAADDLEAIRIHLNKDCALGSSKFQDEVEAMVGRGARIVPQGRPRKPSGDGER